jgi:small-conductance mechanosensitive channel
MQTAQDKAREDIAFLRAIVDEHSPVYKQTGIIYGASGGLFGFQALLGWLHVSNVIKLSDMENIAIAILPTALFFIVLALVLSRDKENQNPKGTASKTVIAMFGAAGIANLVLALVFAYAAFERQDFSIWLFFPVVVCALQGMVWYVVAMIRKYWWMWATSAGWYGTALVAGLFTQSLENYLLALSVGLFLFMAVPGLIMARIKEEKA